MGNARIIASVPACTHTERRKGAFSARFSSRSFPASVELLGPQRLEPGDDRASISCPESLSPQPGMPPPECRVPSLIVCLSHVSVWCPRHGPSRLVAVPGNGRRVHVRGASRVRLRRAGHGTAGTISPVDLLSACQHGRIDEACDGRRADGAGAASAPTSAPPAPRPRSAAAEPQAQDRDTFRKGPVFSAPP